jgi:AAA+ superfamily predicted ATPase
MRFQKDLITLLKARNTLIWIRSPEENRAEGIIVEAGGGARYPVYKWDCDKGIQDAEGNVISPVTDPTAALRYVEENTERRLYIFRDLHSWIKDPIFVRVLRSLVRELQRIPQEEARVIVSLSPSIEVPPELSSTPLLDLPLPDREEMGRLLDDIVEAAGEKVQGMNGGRELAIDSAMGLSAEEAGNSYAMSLVSEKTIDPSIIVAEKKRVIARAPGVEWYEPDPRGMDGVGGLDVIKFWLEVRRKAFSAKAREFGLPPPKGIVIVGLPGGGKSLTAKCVAASWAMPLLRLDIPGQRSKYVGESEQNIRNVFKIAEAVAPCVLWVDEIEKALAGSTGPQGDGGVASDALGTLLSWMQEKTKPVFVVATANQVENLPPELLRKGRFDEMFFVDLPTAIEREAILKITLKQFGRENVDLDIDAIVAASDGFTGAEIAALISDSMFAAFNEDAREIRTEDLLTAAKYTVPLSKTASEKIEALRKWAKGRARFASSPDNTTKSSNTRVLDI